jgi:hypothetical protein
MKYLIPGLILILLLFIIYFSRVIDGFDNMQNAPIPRFVKTLPIVPKRPPPSTNSNGGLVYISQV